VTGVVVTCEHAGNAVPQAFAELFAGQSDVLSSHRGWDPGAVELARVIARRLGVAPHLYPWTRLLIEVNRSEGHRAVFSYLTRQLDPQLRHVLLRDFYRPHRERVTAAIEREIQQSGRVLHLAVHTFTPILDGRPRAIDIASLDDPRRPRERAFSNAFLAQLRILRPALRLALNRPYRGWSDGLTTTLRAHFPAEAYLGIEIEVSQAFPLGDASVWNALQTDIAAACERAHAALSSP
jgi:predicted N-formylglutamate amidohydrolase